MNDQEIANDQIHGQLHSIHLILCLAEAQDMATSAHRDRTLCLHRLVCAVLPASTTQVLSP